MDIVFNLCTEYTLIMVQPPKKLFVCVAQADLRSHVQLNKALSQGNVYWPWYLLGGDLDLLVVYKGTYL